MSAAQSALSRVSESHLGCHSYNWSQVQVAVITIQAERDWILCQVRAGAEEDVFIQQTSVLCEVLGENVETVEHRTYITAQMDGSIPIDEFDLEFLYE
jgi:hypothetical protein